MKRSLSFTEKFLMALSAVMFVLLFLLLIGPVVGCICVAALGGMPYFIMAVSFGYVLLLALLALLASSLRQPVTPPESRFITAMLQYLQPKVGLAGHITIIAFEAAFASVMFWIWAVTPLEFGRRDRMESVSLS